MVFLFRPGALGVGFRTTLLSQGGRNVGGAIKSGLPPVTPTLGHVDESLLSFRSLALILGRGGSEEAPGLTFLLAPLKSTLKTIYPKRWGEGGCGG